MKRIIHRWARRNEKNYARFLQRTDLDKMPSLQIGSISGMKEAEEEGLYQWMEDYPVLLDKYSLSEIAPGPDDFSAALQVMDWLTAHTYYCGLQSKLVLDRTPAILAYAYDKPFRHAINCRFKAIAMADCLLALQRKAYPVALIAQEEKGKDMPCHLMVHMYARELKKWVLFDPSLHTYFFDEADRPLDAFELRELMMEGRTPRFPGYDLNGSDGLQDIYIQSFVRPALTHITTWNNSIDKRNVKAFQDRQAFDCVPPGFGPVIQAQAERFSAELPTR